MALVTYPSTVLPSAMGWGLKTVTQTFRSPLSGTEQTLELPGAIWMLDLSYEVMTEDELAYIEAFLLQMRGAANRAYMVNFARKSPRGQGLGTPLVKTANQVGTSLLTDGWTPDQYRAMRRGDMFHVETPSGRELKQLTADVNANGSGEVTLVFEPPLRAAPPDNGPIVIDSPSCLMRLVDDEQARWSISPGLVGSFSVQMQESFTP